MGEHRSSIGLILQAYELKRIDSQCIHDFSATGVHRRWQIQKRVQTQTSENQSRAFKPRPDETKVPRR